MKILLVGGAVRNLLLGRAAADKDFLVLDATEQDFLARFPRARRAGKAFPVFLVDGEEYSFLRRSSLNDDLEARDFTVNAMALDEDGELVAHPLGPEDLHHRLLRQASEKSFDDDLLRIYRAARFLAQLADFQPALELFPAMRRAMRNGDVSALSAERVGGELRRALGGEAPGRFLRVLAGADCLGHWFAEFVPAARIPAGPAPHHDASVLEHTARVMDRLAGHDELTVWMGMAHDVGKCATPAEELPRHLGHERRGETMAADMGRRLRLPDRFVLAGAACARWHMLAVRYDELRPGTRVDLLSTLHARRLVAPLFSVVRADAGVDHLARAEADLSTMLGVTLPPDERDRGAQSGQRLRELRARALAGY